MTKQIIIKKRKVGRGYRYLVECLNCHKRFEIIEGNLNQGRGKYCSKKCYWKDLKGKNLGKKSSSWKNGTWKDEYGYIWVYSFNHPKVKNSKRKYVKRSNIIVEKCIGRYLAKDEIVHHINEIKDDDRPENLYLFLNNSIHKKYHGNQYLKNKPKPLKSNIIMAKV